MEPEFLSEDRFGPIPWTGGGLFAVVVNRKHRRLIVTEPVAIPGFRRSEAQQVLVVEVDDERIGLPASAVQRIVQLDAERLKHLDRAGTFLLDDQPVLGLQLRDFIGQGRSWAGPERSLPVPILEIEGEPIGLVVDSLLDVRHGATIETLSGESTRFLGRCRMRDDRLIPVVDPRALLEFLHDRERSSRSRRSQVLVIDDSRAARSALAHLVRSTEAEVTTAGSVDEALTTFDLTGVTPDLILLDAELEGLEAGAGTAVLRRTPGLEHVPIVVLALRGATEHRRTLLELGATEILLKPFSVETLLQLIRRFADPSENIW